MNSNQLILHKGQKITFDIYRKFNFECEVEVLNKNCLYLITLGNRKYLVERKGKCNPSLCGSACCKIISIHASGKYPDNEPKGSYWEGFSAVHYGNSYIINKQCVNLSKCGKCKLWNHKKFPGPCKEFPYLFDGVYVHSMTKCTFYFVIKEVIV